jgi:hypothetical protein
VNAFGKNPAPRLALLAWLPDLPGVDAKTTLGASKGRIRNAGVRSRTLHIIGRQTVTTEHVAQEFFRLAAGGAIFIVSGLRQIICAVSGGSKPHDTR